MNRRRWVLGAGAAAAAGVAGGWWWRSLLHDEHRSDTAHGTPSFPLDPSFPNPLRLPGSAGMNGVLEVAGALTMVAGPVMQELVPGKPTSILAYQAEQYGSTYFNPLMRVRSGSQLRIKL